MQEHRKQIPDAEQALNALLATSLPDLIAHAMHEQRARYSQWGAELAQPAAGNAAASGDTGDAAAASDAAANNDAAA